MRKSLIGNCVSAESIVEVYGNKVLKKLKEQQCDFTNRVMHDGDDVEFTSHYTFLDGDFWTTLTAYYYQDKSDVIGCENLDELEWEIDSVEVNSHNKAR